MAYRDKKTALILVDIQFDFLPSGALAVANGDKILPVVYKLLEKYRWDLVAASVDYHPPGHVSFASTHGKEPFTSMEVPVPRSQQTIKQDLWPDHCVQGTHGGAFEDGVQSRMDALPEQTKMVIIAKGSDVDIDSYSAFADNVYSRFTDLPKFLFSNGIQRVVVVGLATDYCVRATAIDARKFGLETTVISDGVRAVFPDREQPTLDELAQWGATIQTEAEYAAGTSRAPRR